MIVAAASAEAAMRLAGRTTRPRDIGPATNPERAAQGWRRYQWDDDAVLDKIRKLLTLAGNHAASEQEAANAAAAAQRLIEQHRLETAVLRTPEAEEKKDADIGIFMLDTNVKKVVPWRSILARGITRVNGCFTFWSYEGPLVIVGKPENVRTATQLYAWLSREIDRLGGQAAKGKSRSYGRAWRMGCADRIAERLYLTQKAAREEARERLNANGVSLVKIDEAIGRLDADLDLAKRWAMHSVGAMATIKTRSTDMDGYVDGRRAGDNISLGGHRALDGGKR